MCILMVKIRKFFMEKSVLKAVKRQPSTEKTLKQIKNTCIFIRSK